jgi:hypothetical protein
MSISIIINAVLLNFLINVLLAYSNPLLSFKFFFPKFLFVREKLYKLR